MHWQFADPSEIGYAYMLIGGFLVAFSAVSLLVKERLYINEVVLGTIFGILIGPHCANIVNPRSWTSDANALTLEITRFVLVIGLFAIGVKLPRTYMARSVKSLLVLVVPSMAIGWFISAVLIYTLSPRLGIVASFLISACLTPTDPIISAVILEGKFAEENVHGRLRSLIEAESASNDGMAYPFLTIAFYVLIEANVGTAIGKWMVIGCLYQVLLGTALGAFFGWALSRVMEYTEKKGFTGREAYLVQCIAVAVLTTGVATTLGVDELLAAFAAGSAINWSIGRAEPNVEGRNSSATPVGEFKSVIDADLPPRPVHGLTPHSSSSSTSPSNLTPKSDDVDASDAKRSHLSVQINGQHFPGAIDFILNCACFLYIGAWLPFDQYNMPSLGVTPWRLVVLSIGILILRRIPSVLFLYTWIEEIPSWREALFAGHFGPMGVSAVFVSTLVITKLDGAPTRTEQTDVLEQTIQPIVTFVVLSSIIVHGLSIPLYTACNAAVGKCTASRMSRSTGDPEQGSSKTDGLGDKIRGQGEQNMGPRILDTNSCSRGSDGSVPTDPEKPDL
ncbi:unnamed protein product [Peniophora sp. CBMAI 1063]|nr:unnamed protein product [Peniophora sp. CBMAI 1063]